MQDERPSSRQAQGAQVITTCDISNWWFILASGHKSRDLRLKRGNAYYRRMTQAIAPTDLIVLA